MSKEEIKSEPKKEKELERPDNDRIPIFYIYHLHWNDAVRFKKFCNERKLAYWVGMKELLDIKDMFQNFMGIYKIYDVILDRLEKLEGLVNNKVEKKSMTMKEAKVLRDKFRKEIKDKLNIKEGE